MVVLVFVFFLVWLLALGYLGGRGIWDTAIALWLSPPVFIGILLGHITREGVDVDALLSWVAILVYGALAAITGAIAGAIWRAICQTSHPQDQEAD